MPTGSAARGGVFDAHRHLGVLAAHPFSGGPPVRADTTAVPDASALLRAMDDEGTQRALVIPDDRGRASDEACAPQLDAVFGAAREHGLVVHVRTSPGGASDVDEVGERVHTDTSWAVGFAPRWLAAEVERRGTGHDRVLHASDEPWGDAAGEPARPWLTENFSALPGRESSTPPHRPHQRLEESPR